MRNYLILCFCLQFIILFAAPVHSADVTWEGWSFDYSTSSNSSGLVLKDVKYNDKSILAKASMPVMRVKYDNNICGPYADILSSRRLSIASSGAPNTACDNQAVCRRKFTRNGEDFLEIGSNWQIGEYQIYQTYYFSENGYIDARVYSRGLQCTVDHSHHAHWMLDFDIDGHLNDQISRDDGVVLDTEFNDLKANTEYWTIQDSQTNLRVRLTPSVDDGQPGSFAQWDLAARRYYQNETGLWTLGARGEIGEHYLNSENINSKDLMVWYVSHLPHSANEGSSIWHASGPRIEVLENSPPPPPAPPPEPPPEPPANNLLANGDFESEDRGWFDCAMDANSTHVNTDTQQGSGAMLLSDGGCLYQEVEVSSGNNYNLTCQARRNGSNWTIMELSFLDSNFNALATEITQISSDGEYGDYTLTGNAPLNSIYGLALLYSEDQTHFDSCVMQLIGDTTPPVNPPPASENQLSNGGFETNLNNWNSCAATSLISVTSDANSGSQSVAIQGGGCLYQVFDLDIGESYHLDCSAKRTGQQYTSVTLAILDSNYATIESQELPVNSSVYQNYSSTLSAVANSKFGTVVLYSENPAHFDDCSVTVNTVQP